MRCRDRTALAQAVSARDDQRDLHALAQVHGLQPQYRAADGGRRTVADDTLVALLKLLGAPLDGVSDAPEALLEYETARLRDIVDPVVLQWDDEPLSFEMRVPNDRADIAVVIELEGDGGVAREAVEWSARAGHLTVAAGSDRHHRQVTVPRPLPFGCHRVHVRADSRRSEAWLLAAPRQLPVAPPQWGVFAPMYALHEDAGATTGTLSTFDRFSGWAASIGARIMGTLPLLAAFYGAGSEPCNASPYSPVSRRHWNEVYLDLHGVPEIESSEVALIDEPSTDEFVDLAALAARRRPVLEAAAARLELHDGRRAAFAHWLDARPDVVAYARFRAAVQAGVPGASEAQAVEDPIVRYHAYVQWVMEAQLDDLARRMRGRGQELYLDLPIGAHPDGFDVASEHELFARGAAVGAPPDLFFSEGQNWGFPPIVPGAARASGYRYLRECLDAHARFARWLRVDHVLGFHRMWWVPDGAPATEGAYVTYPAEEQYAIVSLAAQRHGAHVVGENLGTVPPETNTALRRHRMLGMYVVQFELDPARSPALAPPAARTLACLDTHDTATFAAYWRDLDDASRRALVASLDLDADAGPLDVLAALFEYLGTSRADVVLANVEDLWLETEAQNVPGTTDDERPNFRRRLARSVDEIETSAAERDLLRRLDRSRSAGTGGSRDTIGGRS